MRILDNDNDKALKNLTIYLKVCEAKELLGDLQRLVKNSNDYGHAHINDEEFIHEITLVVYDESDLKGLNNRSKKIISEDV